MWRASKNRFGRVAKRNLARPTRSALVVGRRSRNCAAPVKTKRQRTDDERQAKLQLVRELMDSGLLVIRQITDDERRRYPLNRSDAECDDDARA